MPAPPGPAAILGREPGAIGGSNVVASVQQPIIMGDRVWQWDWQDYPTVSIIQKLSRDPIAATHSYHLEDKPLPHWVQWTGADESAGSESADFSSKITGWDRLNVYDCLFNPRTEEIVMMTVITNVSTLTAIRGDSVGSHTKPMLKGDPLFRFTSQKEEGGTAREAMSTIKERIEWYAGIWRHSTELTYDTAATEMYGGAGAQGRNERLYQRLRARTEHKREMSQHFFLGPGLKDVATSTSVTYGHKLSRGLLGFIQTHYWNVNGKKLTWNDLKAWMQGPLTYIKGDAMLVTSQKIIDIITDYGNSAVRITPNQKFWGWEFDELHVGARKIALVREAWMDENPHLAGMAFLISPANAKWHPVIGNSLNLDTKLHKNIKSEDGRELFKDEYVTHGGFEFFVEGAWGFLKGVV